MKYCMHCGKEINDDAVVCVHCGRNANSTQGVSAVEDSGSAGWGVLGFLVPLVGLILFIVWQSTKPKSAKAAGIGALVSVILSVAFAIIYFVVIVSLLESLALTLPILQILI